MMDTSAALFVVFLFFTIGAGCFGLVLVHWSENSREWYPRTRLQRVLTTRQFERYSNCLGMFLLVVSVVSLMLPLVIGFF